MNRIEKKKLAENLNDIFSRSKAIILTDYKGLNVTDMNDLRRKLREANVEYQVVKNTLLRLASDETDAALVKDYFKGPSAVAMSFDDPTAPAKVLSEFAKKNDKLEIKIGVMDGKVLDLSEIKVLADIPSREVLLGQLLSVINGVPTGFVRVLNGVTSQFMNVLQAIKDQKEAA